MRFLKKILLIDHEPRMTAAVRSALEATGNYIIKEEHDTRATINSARWFQPDLILLDVMMNKPDAGALVEQLQTDPLFKDTPLAFVNVNTAADDGIMSAGILSGYSFFANPVRMEDFVRYVGEILRAPDALRAH